MKSNGKFCPYFGINCSADMAGTVRRQYFIAFANGTIDGQRLFCLFPQRRAKTITHLRINILTLHHCERMIRPQVMTFLTETNFS